MEVTELSWLTWPKEVTEVLEVTVLKTLWLPLLLVSVPMSLTNRME